MHWRKCYLRVSWGEGEKGKVMGFYVEHVYNVDNVLYVGCDLYYASYNCTHEVLSKMA